MAVTITKKPAIMFLFIASKRASIEFFIESKRAFISRRSSFISPSTRTKPVRISA